MFKKFILALMLVVPALVLAQSTTVSGTVIDTDSQAWFAGSVVASFVPAPGTNPNQYTWSGGAFNAGASITIPITAGGNYSGSIPSNTAMNLSGSKWTLTTNSGTTSLSTQSQTISITGGTQTVNFVPAGIRITAGPGAVAYADIEVAAQVGQSYFQLNPTAASAVTRICQTSSGSVCSLWANSGGGSSSPSSLTTFFSVIGLSPTDCSTASCNTPGVGAKGDGKFFFDGNITATLTTLTAPTTTPFCNAGSVPCNGKNTSVGMIVEIQGAGAAGAVLHTTIASVTNSSTAVLVAAAGTTVTNKQVLMGDDDCTFLTNWGNNIATSFGPHNGYLPGQVLNGSVTGQFLTSCPVRIVNPFTSGTNTGECAAVAGPTVSGNLNCPLIIQGAGPGMSDIVPLTAGQFNWGSVNTGVLYLKGWATGLTVSQIGIIGDGSSHNTTAIGTRIYGGLVLEQDSHAQVMQNWFTGMGNTSNNIAQLHLVNDFESLYQNNAIEGSVVGNNYGIWVDNTSGHCTAAPSNNFNECNKIRFYANQIENNLIGVEVGSQTTTGTYQGMTFYDDHIFGSSFASFQMTSNLTMAGKEGILLDRLRVNGGSATDLGVSIQSGATGRLDISNSYLDEQLGGTAVSCLSASGDMNFSNTTINSSAVAVNNTACPFIHFMLGSITGTVTGANAGTFFSFNNTVVGWTGKGVNQGTTWSSDQGNPCTNGELALSAGWQSTGSATVTAAAGNGQTCSWTITTGTTTAANPTVTDTLTNVLPEATTVCWMSVNGGTHTPIVGAGTSDAFRQTTLSATAPIFTYQETPTAGGTTYFVTRGCGP